MKRPGEETRGALRESPLIDAIPAVELYTATATFRALASWPVLDAEFDQRCPVAIRIVSCNQLAKAHQPVRCRDIVNLQATRGLLERNRLRQQGEAGILLTNRSRASGLPVSLVNSFPHPPQRK